MEAEKVDKKESNKKLCATKTTSLPLKPMITRGTSVDHYSSCSSQREYGCAKQCEGEKEGKEKKIGKRKRGGGED